nr:hypothetical protein [Oscillochloris trichoides]
MAQKTQKAKWFKGSLNSAKAYAAVSFVDGMVGLATMANLFMPSPQPNMPSYNDIVQDFAAVQIQERNQEHIETARLMMRSAGKPKITRKK